MIKFFRKIKKRFLTENKFSNYLIYAIGEIVLVVAGIVIALQINNWNEARKNKAYELTMLKEVIYALEVDSKVLEETLPYIQETMKNIKKLSVIKNDRKQSTDSLHILLQEVFNHGTTISYNKSPYNTLESVGLDKISNPEIRNKLSKLYGFTLSNAEIWVNEVLRRELFKKKDLYSQIFGLNVEPGIGNSIRTGVRLNNPNIIYDNPEFEMLLSTSGWALPITYNRLKSLKDDMRMLIEQINLELKKNQ
jgi:hypothetical protein